MLKVILAIIIATGIIIIPANAQTSSEFGYKLHPEKLLENTVGDLEVYVTSNDFMVPKSIKNLKAISSDTDIIKIIEMNKDSESFTKTIKIKAGKPGAATIALAAPGFASKEITLEVFNNNNYPTQMLMQVTPNEFPIDGPRFGYIAVELATTGGLPTIVSEDVVIHIETPNIDVINLRNSEITIKKGEYFAITEFDIIGSGDAIIFANTEGMKRISETVKILEPTGPLEIKLTVIPETYNSFSAADGYAIAQLVDAAGIPVAAEEDIYFELGVDNPDVSVNSSNDFDEVMFDKENLVIKKGEYTAFTKFTPRPNLVAFAQNPQQTFEMFVSVDNYLTTGDTFIVLHDEVGGALEGEGPAITQVLPFLTTGKQEIIGVTYFETQTEVSRRIANSNERILTTVTVPVVAKHDYELNISSSESNTVNPTNAIMKKGENSVILYGDTGTMVPDSSVVLYVTDNQGVKKIDAEPNGPAEESISLKLEPLIPMILAGTNFPFVAYLDEGSEEETTETTTTEEGEVDPRLGATLFVKDGILTFAANDLLNVDSIKVKKNQDYVLSYQTVDEVGTTSLNGQIGSFEGTMSLTSHTTDPTSIHLGFTDNILVNGKNLATIQLLDSVGNPVYAKKDITLELVSNDVSVLKIPDQITINTGEYFKTFELESLSEGVVEIAILSEDLPLSKYDVNVVDISPMLSLDLLGTMNWNEQIEAKLSISIPEIQTSLDGFNVEWVTDGGEIKSIEKITNNQGVATLNIIANDKDKVSITAKVSGNGFSTATISKTVEVLNIPVVGVESEEETIETEILLDTNTMIFIMIPVTIGVTLFMLKKIGKLDMITEKISIMEKLNMGDKIEEIKEKISDIRNH